MSSSPPLLEMEHVSVMRGDRLVLDDLSLRVGAGEHVALLGPNGCGKSTLIKTLARECYPLARPETRLAIMGRTTWHVLELRSLLGIVSNDLTASCTRDITGMEAVLSGFFSSIGVWPYHEVTGAMREQAQRALELVEAPHLADRWVDEMSSGEARRIVIARALVHAPQALLFDEPSNSLDLAAQRELRDVMRKLARQGTTLVLVTHHLPDIIPEVDRVIVMSRGRLVADGSKEEILTKDRLSSIFAVPVELIQQDGYFHVW